MLVVFIYMTIWGVERSCFKKERQIKLQKKSQAQWKQLLGIFISWLFPFVLWYNKNIDIGTVWAIIYLQKEMSCMSGQVSVSKT